jgi:hypothetical protein
MFCVSDLSHNIDVNKKRRRRRRLDQHGIPVVASTWTRSVKVVDDVAVVILTSSIVKNTADVQLTFSKTRMFQR